jgi:para-aminobenzoate synthetase/4-amino-4-deoxychorismate lyase
VSDGIRSALLRAEPGSDRFLAFDDPLELLVAREPGEVPALLARAEAAAARGLWAVGFVGYEAAPAFDRALVAHPPATGPAPLAAFTLFAAPRTLERLSVEGGGGVTGRAPAIEELEHAAAIATIREAIARGETYQVNFVFPFDGGFSGRPRDLFARLVAPGEAPFAALLEGDSWAIASLSPELFFERDGERVTMRPMKGTRPRGRFGAEDARLAGELAASEKERAENLMIVDMVRNDLGRVAAPGSVAVESAFAVERYPTVWQMTSTVAAASEARLPGLFAALFPCASVTGAPKAATMRLIRELEPTPRGVYCGAVGFVSPGGRARFAVAIRTLELDARAGRFRYGVGSGVTWDSDAGAEWRECLAKARVLDGPPPEFRLLETMRFRPGRGIELLDLHLERLAASADFFGFQASKTETNTETYAKTFIEGGVRAEVLDRCAVLPPRSHKVRLLLARDGSLEVEAVLFASDRRVWNVAVAREPIPSMDAFVFHKTTNRIVYERARSSAPGGEVVDEVLLVNERGELTEGTRTNLFVQMPSGEWLTPPREAGLLAGVFRESLLRAGRVAEATLYPSDLARAHRVRLGNALRGWIAVDAGALGRNSGAGST